MTTELTPRQMTLVKQTVAFDCNGPEFDLYMAAAKSYGLDPFRKQIIPLVFSKDNPKKRRMSIVVTRDGLRVIAQRCGNYRPASKPPEFEFDPALISDTNPKGIVSVTVYLHQRDQDGSWWDVAGTADWDEFAPITEVWEWDQSKGGRAPTGRMSVDGNWAKMPKVMITKCAEAQALRAGWPDQFSGLYVEEEMDRLKAEDMTASEAVEAEAVRRRDEAINGGKSTLMCFDGSTLERVSHGDIYDRCMEHLSTLDPIQAHAWSVQNREGLKEFWAAHPNDALALKKQIEAKTADLTKAA